ncbi:hypothetical protein ACFVYJ_10005 [Pontibacter sp. JAM-7]|uniref:hypothetical protein n=1 Tax=Pontibacter sp. JAM-7 TaxID=3366581 RepID=UPI003AF6F785
MILLRWGLLLLLLANCMLFFWFSMQAGSNEEAQRAAADLQRLRLLDEIQATELQPKQEPLAEVAQGNISGWCYEISGYQRQSRALAQQQWLQDRQVTAYVESERTELQRRYLLQLPAGVSISERLRLLDALRKHDLAGVQADMSGMRRTLSVYDSERDADQARALLGLLDVQPSVVSDSPYAVTFKVLFDSGIDEILFNKIKEIVASELVELKIRKKVCAGVESLKRTE